LPRVCPFAAEASQAKAVSRFALPPHSMIFSVEG
jgi:hypothetical protein